MSAFVLCAYGQVSESTIPVGRLYFMLDCRLCFDGRQGELTFEHLDLFSINVSNLERKSNHLFVESLSTAQSGCSHEEFVPRGAVLLSISYCFYS